MFNNPLKKLTLNNLPKRIYSQSNLWKYGISGDIPILLVKIEDLNDMYVVKDILKAYEYFRSKNVKVDLVILNREENSYDQYVNYEIENAILNRQVEYLKNISGGIFVLNINQIDKEMAELFNKRMECAKNIAIYKKENKDEDYSVSRDLSSSLLGEKIVCLGYARIFNTLLYRRDSFAS